jgi:hypothetical protein
MGMGRNLVGVGFLALALAGCASSEPVFSGQETTLGASVNVPPASYKSEVLAYLRNYLNDLSGIREAAISPPVLRKVGSIERYVSCVRFSARTPGASPSGREYLVIFLAGKLDQMGATGEQCREAAYQPFPELEQLKR